LPLLTYASETWSVSTEKKYCKWISSVLEVYEKNEDKPAQVMVQDLYVISMAAKWWNFIKITVFWVATPCSMAKGALS
jgi:hypothetical protein